MNNKENKGVIDDDNFDREAETGISLKLLLPLLAAIIAVSPFAIDLYLPAMTVLANEFDTSITTIQNSLSIYLLGYALGLLFFGPLADKFSRRKLIIFGLSGFFITTILLTFSQNISQFLILRFVQAFVSSAATVVVPGIIREYYGKNLAKGLSYVSMIMMLAPMIAPSIGSVFLVLHSWQLIFWALALYSLVVLVLAIRYLPEAKSKKIQVNVGFLARYKIVLSHQKARLDLITSMMISLAFFAYITTIPFVYMSVFKLSEFTFSIIFAINVVALMVAHFINTRLVVRKGSRFMLSSGLILAVLTSTGLVVVTFLELPLFYTIAMVFPLMGSISMVAVNADALVLIEFAEQSGTATAVIGTLRFGIGALAGPILAMYYDGSAMPFALLMWFSILIVMLCQLTLYIAIKK